MAIALLVPGGLGEDASQLDFPRMGRLTFRLALPAHRLFLHHRYSRPIHLHIQDRNRLRPPPSGRSNCTARWISSCSPCGDILSDGFRRPLHGFGGHLQIGEQLHLLASVIEGRLLAHHRLHAAHPGRELRVFDVQFDIGGELAGVAVRAQVVGARHFHLAHRRQNRFGAQFPVVSRVAARARQRPLFGGRSGELQQFGEGRGSGLMHRRSASASRWLPDPDAPSCAGR